MRHCVLDDLVQAITRELRHVLPDDRLVLGMLQEGGAILHRLADEPHGQAPHLDVTRVTGNDIMLIHKLRDVGQTEVIPVFESLLEGTEIQAILQQYGLRFVLVVPLISHGEPLGVLFVGHVGDPAITPDEVQLFVRVGELVTEAIIRIRRPDQNYAKNPGTSTVLATITHELGTPLTSIIGFTEMLDRGVFGQLPEHVSEPLAICAEIVRRCFG